MKLEDRIKKIVQTLEEEMVSIRRHLHAHPELSFQESETMKFVSSVLDRYKIKHEKGIGGYGIVGEIGNANEGCVALRADMDALPIQEKTGAVYSSKNPGIMHACGHDVHTTCLIGAAICLKRMENELDGKVKLIFQPAEEKIPGGAIRMIEEGVLMKPPVPEVIFGLHVHPPLACGKIGMREGFFMASADEIHINIQGQGGHAAAPQDFVDPVAIAAQIIINLQQIVSRMSNPAIPTVLSFGHINTGEGSYNVIPDKVHITGTLRTMDESWRRKAWDHIKDISENTAASLGGSAIVEIIEGYPPLVNEHKLTRYLYEKGLALHQADSIEWIDFRMSGEDFARYLQYIPGVFFRLGVSNESKGINAPVHSPYFDVDEKCLYYGASSMAYFALKYLEEGLNR